MQKESEVREKKARETPTNLNLSIELSFFFSLQNRLFLILLNFI